MTSLAFLGIEIDSIAQELRLPSRKLSLGIEIDSIAQELRLLSRKPSQLQLTLKQCEGKHAACKHELQSLIGMLNHSASMVRPGRTFFLHLIDTMKVPKKQSHQVCLDLQCRSNIAWWSLILERWNGTALLPSFSHGPAIGVAGPSPATPCNGSQSAGHPCGI